MFLQISELLEVKLHCTPLECLLARAHSAINIALLRSEESIFQAPHQFEILYK